MNHSKHIHAVYADLGDPEAGSVWEQDQTVCYFQTEQAAKEFISERRRVAEITAGKTRDIILREGMRGGLLYVFEHVYMRYPKRELISAEAVDEHFRNTITFVDWDAPVEELRNELETAFKEYVDPTWLPLMTGDIPYLVEADRLDFEMPENY